MVFMANVGAYPVDPTTLVGKFRLMVGDSDGVPIGEPPQTTAEYNIWSDVEIEALLTQSNDSVALAISLAYTQLAAQAAANSGSIRTDDLSVNNTSKSGEFLKLAQYWADVAASQEADGFNIVYPSFGSRCGCGAEGSSREVCGCNPW